MCPELAPSSLVHGCPLHPLPFSCSISSSPGPTCSGSIGVSLGQRLLLGPRSLSRFTSQVSSGQG